ncbi:YkgJ family cysteine cluster protein [Helicobacter pylori]|uniref:YkgJ family cysteine cluster protein n=1 Tax=Helicobacter pylori TaxID=210 RepID=UPI001AE64C3F|nr:YkgJ family cysteine cluster protein [Helicobacter pylori]QTP01542.1 YkgJ family cysteine cluster protein [Helicobacter pylori]
MRDFDFSFNHMACEGCGAKCCVGESGYIFVSIQEMQQISAFLKLELEEFSQKYVKKVGYKFSLLEKDAKDLGLACVFLDLETKKCQIYSARPKQCQTFPFWESVKTFSKEQKEAFCQSCPGITQKTKETKVR